MASFKLTFLRLKKSHDTVALQNKADLLRGGGELPGGHADGGGLLGELGALPGQGRGHPSGNLTQNT